jgi:hypothetical protein
LIFIDRIRKDPGFDRGSKRRLFRPSDGNVKSILTLKDNINLLERNHAIMQLHDVDISQSHKSNIRNLVDGDIDGIKNSELSKLYIQDKLHSVIPNWDNWLKKNFTSLNLLRNKHAR